MKPRILIVDDDDINLAILEEILAERYPLVSAGDGQEALEMAAAGLADLVLMDIMMPRMDGYEACRRMKALPHRDRLHVVLVSAKASTTERLKGYEAGADDYLVKPYEPDELLAKVRVHERLIVALRQLDDAGAELAADNDQLIEVVGVQARELGSARDLTVFALANLADSRDPETGAHLERIRLYCHILAEHMETQGPYTHEIDEAFVARIFQASPLHDIGKVGIPDAVLLKPGRLCDEEFELMKNHSAIGAKALRDAAGQAGGSDFLDMAVDIAQSHHERWDGAGYPDGLAGGAIPLAARIAAVADVFDVLTSVRVYKDAFSAVVAKQMIVGDSGTHFDPAVVEAFVACYDAFVATRKRVDGADAAGATGLRRAA